MITRRSLLASVSCLLGIKPSLPVFDLVVGTNGDFVRKGLFAEDYFNTTSSRPREFGVGVACAGRVDYGLIWGECNLAEGQKFIIRVTSPFVVKVEGWLPSGERLLLDDYRHGCEYLLEGTATASKRHEIGVPWVADKLLVKTSLKVCEKPQDFQSVMNDMARTRYRESLKVNRLKELIDEWRKVRDYIWKAADTCPEMSKFYTDTATVLNICAGELEELL